MMCGVRSWDRSSKLLLQFLQIGNKRFLLLLREASIQHSGSKRRLLVSSRL
jgi:hypothetical protein